MEKNVNTLKKQLVAAIAMVLVSAVALGSSTFAWFVNNTSVEARGMQVNAVASGSLVIKGMTNSTDTEYTSIGTVGSDTQNGVLDKALAPATSFDGLSFGKLATGVQVQSANNSAATWRGTEGAFNPDDIVTIATPNNSQNVLQAQYNIASVGEACDVYVSNVTISHANVQAALRMSVTIGSTTYVYNIGGGTATKVGKLDGDTWSLEDPAYDEAITDNFWSLNKVDQANDTTASTVTVNVWYEGQDSACYSNNVDTTGTSIVIEFAKVPKA